MMAMMPRFERINNERREWMDWKEKEGQNNRTQVKRVESWQENSIGCFSSIPRHTFFSCSHESSPCSFGEIR